MADPFAAHPELRPLIRDPTESVFRNHIAAARDKDVPNPAPPAGDGYAGVTCGFQLVCGWRADGFASCSGVAGAPPGLYARIEAGSSHACGFDPAGSLTCWPDVVSSAAALGGPGLVDVAAGDFSTCGIRTDGTVTCWGVRDGFTPRPPEGFAPFGENP